MDKDRIALLRRIDGAGDQLRLTRREAAVFDGLRRSGLADAADVVPLESVADGAILVFPSVTDKGFAALDDLNGTAREVAVSGTEDRPSWFRRNRDSIIVGVLTSSIVAILFKLLEPYVFGGE